MERSAESRGIRGRNGHAAMKYDEFKKAVDRIIEDEDTLMIHVSPDFQCDQTLGFPTSLCVCWEQGKAWLVPQ